MHDQAMPPADPRAEFIAALRDLAGYLAAHPSLPVPYITTTFHVFPRQGYGQRAGGGSGPVRRPDRR